jgi:hypothetical protein
MDIYFGSFDYKRFKMFNADTIDIVTDLVKQVGVEIPNNHNLAQNYPNPFNPITHIEFQIPDNQFVSLKILNLLGQEIATLVNENKPAGKYTVIWNASGFASGVYFYQLQAGGFSETRKLILMK